MKIGVVRAEEIAADPVQSLLPKTYLLNARAEAHELLQAWNRSHGNLFDPRSNAYKELKRAIEECLDLVYEKGKKRGGS